MINVTHNKHDTTFCTRFVVFTRYMRSAAILSSSSSSSKGLSLSSSFPARLASFRFRGGSSASSSSAFGGRKVTTTTSDMKFTVTYSKNWDGGGQEFEAAKAAILAVAKNASVVPNRVDAYPITVTIEEEKLGVVYSGRQQGFFGKNGRPAMKEVEEALRSKM